MALEDEEATTFCKSIGIFYYKVMPFGLKNVDATYQRTMTYIFDDLLHDAIECNVNDLVVKTKLKQHHIVDLDRFFRRLRHYNLKMNPFKCSFGIFGRFLRLVIQHKGIKINPKKITTIVEMPTPWNITEIKRF